MQFEFNCYGHENILSQHRNTIEFTKDTHLTKRGDCIIGVGADFDYSKLKEFISDAKDKKIICEMATDDIKDQFSFFLNSAFSDKEEIVIRKTDFKSDRTLGINADKSAKDIKRELIDKIKEKDKKIKVSFEIK